MEKLVLLRCLYSKYENTSNKFTLVLLRLNEKSDLIICH